MNRKNKGFIGAIGDDLPSLIPIFLGLVVFFAVFLGVFNDYNAKNKVFDLNQEAIEISMQLKSDPVITSYSHFQEKCKITSKKKWVAFIVDLPLNPEEYQSISLQQLQDNRNSILLSSEDEDGNEDYFICHDEKYNADELLNQLKDPLINPINYMYPISLQRDQGYTALSRLYILIWE